MKTIEQIAFEVLTSDFIPDAIGKVNLVAYAARLIAAWQGQQSREAVAWMNPNGGVLQTLSTGLERATFTIPLYLAPPPAVPEWQDIATAPFDECILIYQPKFKRIAISINDGFCYKEATHWMPLPQPPAQKEQS